MPTKLATQILTPIVHQFISDWITSMSQHAGDPLMADLKDMTRRDPVSGLCIQLVNLYILAAIQDYTHPRKRIEKHVHKSISNCKGSWKATLETMLSFIPFGRSFSEIAYHPPGEIASDTKSYLKEIRTVDPERYRFEGSRGEIKQVVYRGIEEIKIPYDRGIHLVNEPHLCFGDPLGVSALVRAYPYWKLHQILLPILSIASQRQATPILVFKTDTEGTIELVDQNGNPLIKPDGTIATISKSEDAKKAIESLGSTGGLIIDSGRAGEPGEEVFAIEQKIASDFLLQVVKLCEQYRMMSYLVPSTIASFSSSGVGDAGLATSQREVFEAISASRASYLAENVIEKVIKPMIIYNFGEQEDYGTFPVSTKDPTALQIAELITGAVQRGAFTANDVAVVDRLRELLGIETENSQA